MLRATLSRGTVSHRRSQALLTARVERQARKLIKPESKACCAGVRDDCWAHACATHPCNGGSISPGAGYEICAGCRPQTADPLPVGTVPETSMPFPQIGRAHV